MKTTKVPAAIIIYRDVTGPYSLHPEVFQQLMEYVGKNYAAAGACFGIYPVDNAILLAISFCWMRAYVLDTDVLVAAFRSDAGASRQVLEAARAHRFELLLSVPLMLEYESVLTRPEHLAACRASREDVSAVLDELALVGKRVKLMIRTRPILPDPNDEMVLETAINGRADAIVTFNERDFRPVAARFRCSVVRPGKSFVD